MADELADAAPDRVIARSDRTARAGRVYVDWIQNDAGRQLVAPYSPRARDRPTVSTPLTWEEVAAAVQAGSADGLVFTMADVLKRVRDQGDLFAETLTVSQKLPIG